MNFFDRLKYYDFQVKNHVWKIHEPYRWVKVKLPAYDVERAIKGFLWMMDTPDFQFFPSHPGNFKLKLSDTVALKYLFRQVIEFDLVKTSGKTIHQYKMINLYNRHDFMPLFDDKYALKFENKKTLATKQKLQVIAQLDAKA